MDGTRDLSSRVARREFNIVPFFWDILREAANDPEKLVLRAVEKDFQDIYLDLTCRYDSLDVGTTPVHKPAYCRVILLREPPSAVSDGWDMLTVYQKDFFRTRQFLEPVDGGRYKVASGIHEADSISTLPDGNGYRWDNDTDYTSDSGYTFFNVDPFADNNFKGLIRERSITAPWGRVYAYNEITLFASGNALEDSPLDTHYTGLVYDGSVDLLFQENSLYTTFVYSFFKVLYQGALIPALQGFVNSIAGSPYILTDREKIIRYTIEFNGTEFVKRIFTDVNSYDIPLSIPVGSWVQIGAVLEKYTPLGEYVKIDCYAEDVDWAHDRSFDTLSTFLDKGTGVRQDVMYDLFTTYNPLEAETVPEMQRPRADIAGVGVNEDGRLFTGTHGLWHNVTGPDFVMFTIANSELNGKIGDVFRIILKEIMPIHILYTVSVGDYLLDDLGQILLDHDGDPLTGII